MTRFRTTTAHQQPIMQARRFPDVLRKRCGNVPASLWPNVSAWGGLIRDPHPRADSGHTPHPRSEETTP